MSYQIVYFRTFKTREQAEKRLEEAIISFDKHDWEIEEMGEVEA